MPLPNDRLECRLLMREIATNNQASVLLYYRKTEGMEAPTVANIQDVANDFKTAFNTAVPACLTTAHQFFGVHVRYYGTANEAEAYSNVAVAAGTRAGETFPEEVAACIQRRTGMQGRANRGRVYMPFVPVMFANGSSMTQTGIEAYQSMATAVKNGVLAPDSGTPIAWEAYTPAFKTASLNKVIQVRVIPELASRRDRRFIKRAIPIPAL
jgi:hypothetical protein